MDFAVMKILRAVDEHGGVRPAARSLNLSPSAVSQQLKALSETLGFPVVERSGANLKITRGGETLARLADRIGGEWESVVKACRDEHWSGGHVTVRLGAFCSAQELCVIDTIKRLHESTPFRVTVSIATTEHSWTELHRGQLDAAISLAEVHRKKDVTVSAHPLWRERLLIVVPKTFASLVQPLESPRALARIPWLLPPAGTVGDQIVRMFFVRHGFRPHVIGRSAEWPLVQKMVAQLGAAALIPASAISYDTDVLRATIDPELLPVRNVSLFAATSVPGVDGWLPALRSALSATLQQSSQAGGHLEVLSTATVDNSLESTA